MHRADLPHQARLDPPVQEDQDQDRRCTLRTTRITLLAPRLAVRRLRPRMLQARMGSRPLGCRLLWAMRLYRLEEGRL